MVVKAEAMSFVTRCDLDVYVSHHHTKEEQVYQ